MTDQDASKHFRSNQHAPELDATWLSFRSAHPSKVAQFSVGANMPTAMQRLLSAFIRARMSEAVQVEDSRPHSLDSPMQR